MWATSGCNSHMTLYTVAVIYTSSFARFARSATSPSFAYVSNPAPDSSLCRAAAPQLRSFSCCSPIASIRFKLLFPVSVRFSCCPCTDCVPSAAARHLRSLQLLFPDFNSSPIASASAAAPQLRPLQLPLPDCVRFNCSPPIASACSLPCSGRFQPMPNVLERSSQSSRFSTLKYEGRASLV